MSEYTTSDELSEKIKMAMSAVLLAGANASSTVNVGVSLVLVDLDTFDGESTDGCLFWSATGWPGPEAEQGLINATKFLVDRVANEERG